MALFRVLWLPALAIILFLIFATRSCYRAWHAGLSPVPRRRVVRTLRTTLEPEEIYDKLSTTIVNLERYQEDSLTRGTEQLTAATNPGGPSWGERITIAVTQASGKATLVSVSSEPRHAFNIFNSGTNESNIVAILAGLDDYELV